MFSDEMLNNSIGLIAISILFLSVWYNYRVGKIATKKYAELCEVAEKITKDQSICEEERDALRKVTILAGTPFLKYAFLSLSPLAGLLVKVKIDEKENEKGYETKESEDLPEWKENYYKLFREVLVSKGPITMMLTVTIAFVSIMVAILFIFCWFTIRKNISVKSLEMQRVPRKPTMLSRILEVFDFKFSSMIRH
ncbi:hypothetical protein P7245_22475 [Vibrio parahaemolyticus]|nr:hypothetical protein [Vibrio parahaemolyticus]